MDNLKNPTRQTLHTHKRNPQPDSLPPINKQIIPTPARKWQKPRKLLSIECTILSSHHPTTELQRPNHKGYQEAILNTQALSQNPKKAAQQKRRRHTHNFIQSMIKKINNCAPSIPNPTLPTAILPPTQTPEQIISKTIKLKKI